jgi:hypothetical protein
MNPEDLKLCPHVQSSLTTNLQLRHNKVVTVSLLQYNLVTTTATLKLQKRLTIY